MHVNAAVALLSREYYKHEHYGGNFPLINTCICLNMQVGAFFVPSWCFKTFHSPLVTALSWLGNGESRAYPGNIGHEMGLRLGRDNSLWSNLDQPRMARDQTGNPGVLRQQGYPLHHHATAPLE